MIDIFPQLFEWITSDQPVIIVAVVFTTTIILAFYGATRSEEN